MSNQTEKELGPTEDKALRELLNIHEKTEYVDVEYIDKTTYIIGCGVAAIGLGILGGWLLGGSHE